MGVRHDEYNPVGAIASEGSKGLTKAFIIFLYSRGKLKKDILISLPDGIKKEVMNTLDIYFEKGIEIGKAQIVQNLINADGFTVSEIANLAGVSESFVRKVRASDKKKG